VAGIASGHLSPPLLVSLDLPTASACGLFTAKGVETSHGLTPFEMFDTHIRDTGL